MRTLLNSFSKTCVYILPVAHWRAPVRVGGRGAVVLVLGTDIIGRTGVGLGHVVVVGEVVVVGSVGSVGKANVLDSIVGPVLIRHCIPTPTVIIELTLSSRII